MIFLREMTVNEDLATAMSSSSTPYFYEMVSGSWSLESFASVLKPRQDMPFRVLPGENTYLLD